MPAGAYYITTPIYYVNDSPHIGHAYTTLACDALARFMRLDGRDVFFLTGTDEHGQKVEKAARDRGTDPQAFTNEVSERFRELARAMGFSNDDFIRTTETRHKRAVMALWEKLVEFGDIYLGTYAGWYSVRDEAFYAESELVDGKAPTGAPVEWVEEPSYFFRLAAWQDRLLRFYEENPDFVLPATRRNEVVSFVKGGLQDLSVSRTSFTWGIPVPGDSRHVMYVWLDALTNYISAVDYPDTDSPMWQRFWPADVHVVGKDILRFHAVYWPAFLMSAGLPPPKRVFAHGWWTVEGQKMSKSLGNVVAPAELIQKYGLDQTRYFLLREIPFGNDGDFSHAAMVRRLNHDLANDFGNLAQRVLTLIQRNCDAQVPEPGPADAGGRGPAGRRQGAPAAPARRDGGPGAAPGAGAALGGGRPGEPLRRLPGPLGAAQDRPGADAHGPVGPGRDAPAPRDPGPALHAGLGQAAARPARGPALPPGASPRSGRRARSRPGTPLPPPTGVFPRYQEASAA